MARRKRLLDKRLHSRHLDEVILGILDSPAWRDTLLELEPPGTVTIDSRAVSGQDDDTAHLIRRNQLSYVISVDAENECGDPDPIEGAKVFKLQATRHPVVHVYAEELIEDIGLGAGVF